MLLSQIDPFWGVFSGGLFVLLGTIFTGIMAYKMNSRQKEIQKSVGQKNGHGDLHARMDKFAETQVAIQTDISQLKTRRASDAERWDQIASEVIAIRPKLEEAIAWQTSHSADDLQSFDELRNSMEHLSQLLGEPEEGMDRTPLIKYFHDFKHDMLNKNATSNIAGNVMLVQAANILSEVQDLLDAHNAAEREANNGLPATDPPSDQ